MYRGGWGGGSPEGLPWFGGWTGREQPHTDEVDPEHYPGGRVDKPCESKREGCPGGWYRSEFAYSISRYTRVATESGYASNPLLDRCDDEHIIEAVRYLEQQEQAAMSAFATAGRR